MENKTLIYSEGGLHFDDIIFAIVRLIDNYRSYLLKIEARLDEDGYHWTVTAEYDAEYHTMLEKVRREIDNQVDIEELGDAYGFSQAR